MKMSLTGRQLTLTDDLKELFDKKLSKFDRFFGENATANIVLSRKHGMRCLELTISDGTMLYRAEEESETFRSALDEAMNSIERQIRKNKTKLAKRLREGAFDAETEILGDEMPQNDDVIVKVKKFPPKPMSPEEAVLQMNLLEHQFFLFVNAETGMISAVYRRRDGGYGLIVPDDASAD